jgi:hypothetical protein
MTNERYTDVDAKVYPTYQCGANCLFCLTDIRPRTKEVDEQTFLANFEKEIARYYADGGRRVLITGGEPTCAVGKLLGLLKIVSAEKYAFDLIALYTNGSRLLDETEYRGRRGTLLSLLNATRLQAINLSIHSDVWQERARLSAALGTLDIETLIYFIRTTGYFEGKSLQLRLGCTLQKSYIGNRQRVRQYIDWATSIGVREIYFRDLFHIANRGQRTTPGDQAKLAYTDRERIDFDRLVQEIKEDGDFVHESSMRRHREWGTTHLFTHAPTGCRIYFGTLLIGSEREGETTYFAINPDGRMTPNMNAPR